MGRRIHETSEKERPNESTERTVFSVSQKQREFQARGYLTKEELYDIARWKSPRRADSTLDNTDDFIKGITKSAFTSTGDWAKLSTLTQLRGVGKPTASAILHLLDDGEYPILDIHALWSVGLPWKKEVHIRSGWNILSFVVKSRTGTPFQCENLTELYGSFHVLTVARTKAHY